MVMLLVVMGGATTAHAQPATIALMVRCSTVADTPVAALAVTVRDAQTDIVLQEGTTGVDGSVRFDRVPVRPVRVMVAGTIADGIALRHTRQDQRGIWVDLPRHDWTMTLRVDTDGLVFPDLGLSDAGAPDAAGATAIARGTLPTIKITDAATPAARTTDTPLVSRARPAVAPSPDTADHWGLLMLLALAGTIAMVVWLLRRMRA